MFALSITVLSGKSFQFFKVAEKKGNYLYTVWHWIWASCLECPLFCLSESQDQSAAIKDDLVMNTAFCICTETLATFLQCCRLVQRATQDY